MVQLGRVAFQELQPRGNIMEKVIDCDVRARRATAFMYGLYVAAFNRNLRPRKPVSRARQQFKLRYGCNAWQRLAAESECVNTLQILNRSDFARRMAL